MGAALALALAAPARADENAEARVLFERGNRRLEEAFGRRGEARRRLLEQALEAYVETLRIVRSRNAVFNAGVTLEALGRLEDAFAYFREYVEMPGLDAAERRAGEARLDALRPRVAVLLVRSTPPGASVRVDRRDLAPVADTPAEVAVAPGPRTLFVTATGRRPAEVSVRAVRGERRTVEVRLEPEAPATPGPPPTATVTVQVRTEDPTAAAEVLTLADGAVAGRGPAARVEGAPGTWSLRVEAPGHLAAARPLTLEAGQALRVDAYLARLLDRDRRFRRWPLGLGVGAAVLGAAYGALALWARDLDGQLGPGAVPVEDGATYDRLRRVAYAADGMAIGAAVLAVGAVVLGLLNAELVQPPSTLEIGRDPDPTGGGSDAGAP